MAEETVIYQQDKIKITNLRAVFGDKTYSISNVSAVELETMPASTGTGAIMASVGVLMVIYAIVSFIPSQNALRAPNPTLLIIGLLLAAVGIFLLRAAKPSYTVKISTSSGEVKALSSENKELISNIVEAINTAIIQKG